MKMASRFKVKAGMQEEYKRRHDELWPEMAELMRSAGICNYTIWNYDEELFGYFEVEDYDACIKIVSASDVKKRWDAYMSDIVVFDDDSDTNIGTDMRLMFEFN